MIIAGGLYLELCEVPQWQAYYGSGGRAAHALSELSQSLELHTYASKQASAALASFELAGISVTAHPSLQQVAFSYFHPMSRPVVVPRETKIATNKPFRVISENVLRFGMIEGDAIVDANRAVFDPQTSNSPPLFQANGSRAAHLALVMNEGEVRCMAQIDSLPEAARQLMTSQRAEVLVMKAGTAGATVFSGDNAVHIPPYLTTRVFKIGTGDVFSALFAHYWAEERMVAADAADLASRGVAKYCETNALPIKSGDGCALLAAPTINSPLIYVMGQANTLGNRWMIEEAVWSLKELGARVICPTLETDMSLCEKPMEPDGALVILDTLDDSLIQVSDAASKISSRILYFSEKQGFDKPERWDVVSDFTSAMYRILWKASMGPG